MNRKTSKMMFFDTFSKFLGFGPNFNAPNSNSVDDFASLDTPGGPGGVKVVELFVFEKCFGCFLDAGAIW